MYFIPRRLARAAARIFGSPFCYTGGRPCLLALTSDSWLVAFQPSDKGYAEEAKYKVADSATWACLIIARNRVFVKDKDSLTLWTME